MSEWLKELAWKAGVGNTTEGSNPSLSAISFLKGRTMKYDKLVRDKIPNILDAQGKNYSTRQCQDDFEKFEYLKRKLIEEVDEFMQSPSIEELADIQEVILSLSTHLGVSRRALEAARKTKAVHRGAFEDSLILEEVV